MEGATVVKACVEANKAKRDAKEMKRMIVFYFVLVYSLKKKKVKQGYYSWQATKPVGFL